MNRFSALRARDVQIYLLCDDLSGALILPMVIFGPWAFGTTQPWSIKCMNGGGCALGLLLLVKLIIRKAKGYPAARWDRYSSRSGTLSLRTYPATRILTFMLAVLTLAVLAEIIISALNVAANYNPDLRLFQYHGYLGWLPHSFDGSRTWFYFWMYLGMAAAFWEVVDWLLGMTAAEERTFQIAAKSDSGKSVPLLPARLRWLLWLLCINGAVLGVEAIVQRASGSNKLLFLVQPTEHLEGIAQFGPYAYRSNAAQYFNLLWPVCLGFWWALQRTGGGERGSARHWLLLCATIMSAGSIISTSRGGALVAVGIMILVLLYFAFMSLFNFDGQSSDGSFRWGTAGALILFVTVTLSLGWYFGWNSLAPRMEQIGEGYQYREEMYVAAQPMTQDYPFFGTGPGTFATVFQLYRYSNGTYWPAQLHNDWLETRITFGWLGFALLLSALACVGMRWFVPGGLRGSRRFVVLAWLGLGGCLVHARWDFPFQIHSTLFLFLVICAILFCLSRQNGTLRR